jgi:hypothetical protein
MNPFSTSRRGGAALFTFGVLAVGSLGVAAGSASATTAHKPRTEYFVTGGTIRDQQFIAHGAIVDSGRDDASHDDYDVLYLAHGTLRLTHPDKNSKFVAHVNPKTCYGTFTLTGKYTVGHGTGRYKHVTGHGKYKGVGYVLASRTKGGACNENAEPKTELFTVQGHGPISLH